MPLLVRITQLTGLPGWHSFCRSGYIKRGDILFSGKKHNEKILLSALTLTLFFVACPVIDDSGGNNTVKPATVSFFSESRYRVDIYKNLNPEHFDPSTLVCTLNTGETKRVEQYPSYDQVIGDVFYPRYKVPLADFLQPGVTANIYVDAQRVLSNMTFVIESDKKYTKTIPDPKPGEVNFLHGYIRVQNMGNTQIQIIRGGTILSKLDNGAVNLNTGDIGFYEIQFSPLDTVITMDQLKAFSSHDVMFPSFFMERGKSYEFTVQGEVITGPVIRDIEIK
jgi:hypothetical protein